MLKAASSLLIALVLAVTPAKAETLSAEEIKFRAFLDVKTLGRYSCDHPALFKAYEQLHPTFLAANPPAHWQDHNPVPIETRQNKYREAIKHFRHALDTYSPDWRNDYAAVLSAIDTIAASPGGLDVLALYPHKKNDALKLFDQHNSPMPPDLANAFEILVEESAGRFIEQWVHYLEAVLRWRAGQPETVETLSLRMQLAAMRFDFEAALGYAQAANRMGRNTELRPSLLHQIGGYKRRLFIGRHWPTTPLTIDPYPYGVQSAQLISVARHSFEPTSSFHLISIIWLSLDQARFLVRHHRFTEAQAYHDLAARYINAGKNHPFPPQIVEVEDFLWLLTEIEFDLAVARGDGEAALNIAKSLEALSEQQKLSPRCDGSNIPLAISNAQHLQAKALMMLGRYDEAQSVLRTALEPLMDNRYLEVERANIVFDLVHTQSEQGLFSQALQSLDLIRNDWDVAQHRIALTEAGLMLAMGAPGANQSLRRAITDLSIYHFAWTWLLNEKGELLPGNGGDNILRPARTGEAFKDPRE